MLVCNECQKWGGLEVEAMRCPLCVTGYVPAKEMPLSGAMLGAKRTFEVDTAHGGATLRAAAKHEGAAPAPKTGFAATLFGRKQTHLSLGSAARLRAGTAAYATGPGRAGTV